MRRDLNSDVDALADWVWIFEEEIGQTIEVDLISAPSHEMPQESILVNIELGLHLMDPIVNFIQHDKLLEDKREVHKLQIKAAWLWISFTGNLYKRLYLGHYLLCIHLSLFEDVLLRSTKAFADYTQEKDHWLTDL